MPNYGVSDRWEKSGEFKKPFNYVLGVGAVDTDEQADQHEAQGKQVVLARRVDMGDLIKLGIAEELDFMSKALVAPEDQAQSDETAKEAVSKAILKSENYDRMERMVNLVVQAGIVMPKLYMPPRDEAARQKGLTYVDHLPWDDRIELFSVIFESEGLSTFRKEQTPGVGDVEHDAGVQVPADGSVDIRSDDPEGVLL